ncbi:hypothetical protein ACQEVX_13415 [Streptomyces syringium]|uniref:hypothetical protein n=1 Tax=Streptomyces syringium TaxID=76729 RepID=UPI003D9167E8
MTEENQRKIGLLAGIALSAGLLPGVTLGGDSLPDTLLTAALTALLFMILTTLVDTTPAFTRPKVPVVLLILGAAGWLQDTLIWLLAAWLFDLAGGDLHVNGFAAAALAGLITRTALWAALWVLPLKGAEAERERVAS